jgi:hypothetical protein
MPLMTPITMEMMLSILVIMAYGETQRINRIILITRAMSFKNLEGKPMRLTVRSNLFPILPATMVS